MSIEVEFLKAIKSAVDETTKDGLIDAQLLSQGTASLGQLASEDHPYARRHGFPLRDPGIINEQTGAFLSDWIRGPTAVVNDDVSGSVENHNPVADYLTQNQGQLGKRQSSMFARPIDEEVEAKMAVHLNKHLFENLASFENLDFTI